MKKLKSLKSLISIDSLILLLLLFLNSFNAYIPALPSNDSINLQQSNENSNQSNSNQLSSINWIIQLNWQPMGIFSDGINLQLKSNNSNQSIHQGVLLHFSEINATSQSPTSVPWIAMINCDSNSTIYSLQDDIFTLARDRGAAAAMLYSLTSKSCKVNQEYLDQFEKPLDVFSSGNLQGARLIESQFSNVLGAGYWFQSDLLNSSASNILKQISTLGFTNLTSHSSSSPVTDPTNSSSASNSSQVEKRSFSPSTIPKSKKSFNLQSRFTNVLLARSVNSPDHPTNLKLNMNIVNHSRSGSGGSTPNSFPVYLLATLIDEASAAINLDQQVPNGTSNSLNSNSSPGNPNTGLAMIILYAITGCVTFMFLIVIISGAIRAIRNPERYGPRSGSRLDPDTGEEEPFGPPQTRAEGLGKAILDTFPIVKFGRQNLTSTRPDHQTNNPESDQEIKRSPSSGENIMMVKTNDRHASVPFLSDLTNSNKVEDEASSTFSNSEVDHGPCSKVPLISEVGLIATTVSNKSDRSLLANSEITAPPHVFELLQPSTSVSSHGIDQLPIFNLQPPEESVIDKKDVGQNIKNELTPEDINLSRNILTSESIVPTEDSDQAQHPWIHLDNTVTCPICVCVFEDDDDIRVLPCDERHQFHKECVDPWLLNESKFCPLCRWDLSTRKDGSKIINELGIVDLVSENDGVHSREPMLEPVPSSSRLSVDHLSLPVSRESGQGNRSSDINPPNSGVNLTSTRISRPAWLSIHTETSANRGSLDRAQRSSNLFSFFPHGRRHTQRNSVSSANQTLSPDSEPTANNEVLVRSGQNAEQLDGGHDGGRAARNRFLKYLDQARKKKKMLRKRDGRLESNPNPAASSDQHE